jgi:nitrate/nitrite transport system substrate-binding protein
MITQNINLKTKLILTVSLIMVLFNAIAGGNPPKRVIKLGFIPLTDCAPLVIAKEMGFFAKYGVDVQLSKEASWAVVRDAILGVYRYRR